jgi:DNA-binding XRE family transcriptional regulator
MIEPLVIIEDGRKYAKLAWEDWERLRELLDDAQDAADLERVLNDPDRDWVPAELADRIFDAGLHPVRAWREHRGLTQAALAEAAGVPQPTVVAIESGTEAGTTDQMRALAQALGISLETLVATL